MSVKNVEVELTGRQAEILVKYTYPFDEDKEQLESFIGKPGNHRLKSDDFYLPMITGDLVYSAKKINDGNLLDEFDGICTIIELAVSRADRTTVVVG